MDSERKIIIITAPSGSGKTSIVRYLLEHMNKLAFSVSATTRSPREDELDGKDYIFLQLDAFQKLIEEDAFAEYEMVYEGKYYGTLKKQLNDIWEASQFPLVDIDVKGALRLKELYQERALSIFIQAPSLTALKERLVARQSESNDMLNERLERAALELEYNDAFDQIVINDVLEDACKDCMKQISNFLMSS